MNGNKSAPSAPVKSDMVQCTEAFAWLAREIKKNRLHGKAVVLHTTPNRQSRRAA